MHRKLAPAFVVTLGVSGACATRVPIEHVGRAYPHTLNPRHPDHGQIYKGRDGGCFVNLPFVEPPSSAGIRPPSKPVDCPRARGLRFAASRALTGRSKVPYQRAATFFVFFSRRALYRSLR